MQRSIGQFLLWAGVAVAFFVLVGGGILVFRPDSAGVPRESGFGIVLAALVAAPLLIYLGFRLLRGTKPSAEEMDGRVGGYLPDQPEKRNLKGRTYEVEYQSRGNRRPSSLKIRVTARAPTPLQFDHKTWFDRLGVWLGIARPHQTGGREFDEVAYVRGRFEPFTEKYLADPGRRDAVQALLRAGFSQVCLTEEHVEANWPHFDPGTNGSPGLDELAARHLFKLADGIPERGKKQKPVPADDGALRVLAVWLAALLYAALFYCAILMPPLRIPELLVPVACAFAIIYPLFGWLSARLLSGHSASHDRWAYLMLFGIVLFGLGTIGAVAAVNALGDPAETREVTVIGKADTGGKARRYSVTVPDWDGRGSASLSVSREEYEQIVPNKTKLELTTGKGRLGIEWIKQRRFVTPRVGP
jgi:hypothetical protein